MSKQPPPTPVASAVGPHPTIIQSGTLCLLSSSGPEDIKFFMLYSAEHEILKAHKYKNIKKSSIFQAQIRLDCTFSCS